MMTSRTRRTALLIGLGTIAALVCIRLGFWQLDRLGQRRALNEAIGAGLEGPQQDAADLSVTEAQPWLAVRASGVYDPQHELVLYGRALEGQPGHHVLTPLILADGNALIVDRGWVPSQMDEPPLEQAPVPEGRVTVEGFLVPAEEGRVIEERGGRPTQISSPDSALVADSLPFETLPLILQLVDQEPSTDAQLPIPAPPPELSQGPHLSYAIQWFAFAVIAVVGSLILIRRDRRPSVTG
jgi:surfeit locus 1 family protein